MTDTEAVPISSSAIPTASSEDSGSDGIYHLAMQVAGAIGTGIGLLGFVTFFGGAILWLRADQAHLPANDAVAVVPHSFLVTTGASFLVPAVMIALAAVVCIFTVHVGFAALRRGAKRRQFSEARDLSARARELEGEGKSALREAAPDRDFAINMARGAELAEQAKVSEDTRRRLIEEASAASGRAVEKESVAREKLASAAVKQTAADDKAKEAEHAFSRLELWSEYIFGGLVLLLLPALCNGAIFHLSFGRVVALIAVAVGVVVISIAVYMATERFVWFGVTAFLTVGIYIGFATYFSTVGNPKVEPVAALRTDRPPAVGMFVADTSANLYLGTFPRQGVPSRMIVIPRGQVTDLTIGPLLTPSAAQERAVALVEHECRIRIATEDDAAASESHPACSESQVAVIRKALGES
jgi:hypothetical protein